MAETLLTIGTVYLWIGAAVAVVFLLWGIERVEPNAKDAWAMRPLLFPGVVLAWPLVLWRWARIEMRGPETQARFRPPRLGQSALAVTMALLIPVILIGGVILRQNGPHERPAMSLDEAGDTE